MMLPRWWPRTSCVYCGRSTRERHPTARTGHGHELPLSPVACWRHLDLVPYDPEMGGPPHPRLALWSRLWRTNRPAALFLADQLVQQRELPPKLLARLRVTTREEYSMAAEEARKARRRYGLTGSAAGANDARMPRDDDQREDGEAARERGA